MISVGRATFSRNTNSSTPRAAKSSCLCPLVFEVSAEGNVSEVAEQLVFLHPVHLWRPLLFFGMDLHLFFCCRSAQAYLSKRVRQPAALIIRQLETLLKMKRQTGELFFHVEDRRPNTAPCMNAHTHLCAVALAAEVGVCGPDGLCGGAAVDLRVSGAVGY